MAGGRTLRSMISAGMSNSSTMHRGMAPPQGCKPRAHLQNESSDILIMTVLFAASTTCESHGFPV